MVAAGVLMTGALNANAGNAPLFYNELVPHGNWIQYQPTTWVWQPYAAAECAMWRPYLNSGQWAWQAGDDCD